MGIFGGHKKDQNDQDQTAGGVTPAAEFGDTPPPANADGAETDDVARKEQEIDAILHPDDPQDNATSPLLEDQPEGDMLAQSEADSAKPEPDGEAIPVNTLQAGDQVFPPAEDTPAPAISSHRQSLNADSVHGEASPSAESTPENEDSTSESVGAEPEPLETSDTPKTEPTVLEISSPASEPSSDEPNKADQILKDSEAKLADVISEMNDAVKALGDEINDYDSQIKAAEASLQELKAKKQDAGAQQTKIQGQVTRLSEASQAEPKAA